ncbi:P-loop NTPase fold protein [Polaromonas sp.]|jgi:hypothetical protein|uniref:KAP family P-loop NTPase fold protein n=1 Tax=Polaromonas sp. TaxID=1869339 RepID=UPI001E069D9A|nr:P-loop NTPase fold protein [Polaromonas sp.]MBT9477164.1 hypothetical protein [Polaromonas sp.]
MNQDKPLSISADSFQITTPFEGDQFGRAALATQLSTYINRLKAGAVIGIDAPWGEGKSWFGRHWAEQLRTDHKVAFIDAFENDYVDDPFVLIASELSALLDDATGQGDSLQKKAAGVMKAIVPMGTKVLINLAGRLLTGTSDLSSDVEDTLKGATDGAADGAEKWIEKRIESMAEERASLKGFRVTLAEAALKSERPVVVMIDELDRCKPSFAVTLIERIKHLFDVPNLVFVLLLNRKQMEIAIEGQYGQGTDGQGYLGKFVNLWFELPKATIGTNGSDARHDAFANHVLERYGFNNEDRQGVEAFRNDIVIWIGAFSMSLRDIDRMCALFVMADRPYTGLLGYLIATKIKHPKRFTNLRKNDTKTHIECNEALQNIVNGRSINSQSTWGDILLVGLAELHQVQAKLIEQKDAHTFLEYQAEFIGRMGRYTNNFIATANHLDLQIESF